MPDEALAPLNHDQELALAIKRGDISKDEVDRIWLATEDLSAQTPINVRRAMIAIRNAKTPEEKVNLSMQFMMAAATEIQAAMTRDETKFAHLVAGTETIVKTLQNVNPLERRLERIEAIIDGLGDLIERRFTELVTQLTKGSVVIEPQQQTSPPSFLSDIIGNAGAEAAPPLESEEAIPDEEREANEARAKSIGSAWAKPAPDEYLRLWKCPNYGCEYYYCSGMDSEGTFNCPIHECPLEHRGAMVKASSEKARNMPSAFRKNILRNT